MREFVRTAVILTPAREASSSGTTHRRQDPEDPLDPLDPEDPEKCSKIQFLETSLELERLAISKQRPLTHFSASTFKNTRFLMTFSSRCPKTQGFCYFFKLPKLKEKQCFAIIFCSAGPLCPACQDLAPQTATPNYTSNSRSTAIGRLYS